MNNTTDNMNNITEEYISTLKHRLIRLKKEHVKLQTLHKGNEQKFTYWGGHSLGYLIGKISMIEDILDEAGIDVSDLEIE